MKFFNESSICLLISFCFCLLIKLASFHQVHDVETNQNDFNNQQNFQEPRRQHEGLLDNMSAEHMREHAQAHYKPYEKMTLAEQNFYNFKMHDVDNNNLLDGIEMFSAISHNMG